ncbi:MAG TPA: 3-isopropylmalate dehydratase small subunit [Burkholderiales bacterium]|nr:3-isopropylmalate dehydratase small subunit [Burkholderiales bacterium]
MKFTRLTAVAAPYDPENVDTDQILPARFLKMPRAGGYGQFLFHDARAADPEFVLDRAPYREAKIFVANRNFACGSSREGAAFAFYDAGFRSVIAPSFSDIFYNNCLRNGIVPVRLADEVCSHLRKLLTEKPGTTLTVDLEKQIVVAPGKEYPFSVDAFFREMLLQGVDELGLTLSMMGEIEAFEHRYAVEFPWAAR